MNKDGTNDAVDSNLIYRKTNYIFMSSVETLRKLEKRKHPNYCVS